jgi:hypothetical protein
LRTLITRLVTVDGPRLETDLATDLLDEHGEAINAAADTSRRTEGLVERQRRHCTEFLADGHINPRERRILAADQRALAEATHATTEKIEGLK